MKKITVTVLMFVVAFAVVTQAHEAEAQIDLGADAKASAKFNISTGGVKLNGGASTTVKGNATSSNASDKDMKGNSTSSASTSVQGNATSSASKNKASTTTSVGAEHRSEVAIFVQTLVNAADRLWGIGEQVRAVAREQASSSAQISADIEKIEARGGFKNFLVGTDFKAIGEIRSELVKTGARLNQLERELQKVGSTTDAITVAAEIDALTKTQASIEAFLKTEEGKFSLFGWVKKIGQ
jgi:hypothetical protein